MIMLVSLIISCLIALIVSPLVIRWYRKNKWLDDPKTNLHPKVVHTVAVPRGGGIPVFVSVAVASLLFIPLDKRMIGILAGALLLTIMGIWDDIKNPSPLIRLGIQMVTALLPIAAGIGIAYVTNPFGGVILLNHPQIPITLFGSPHVIWLLSDIIGFIWIIWCMNIVNFSKGLDGQMPGYVAISAIVIGLLSLKFSQDPSQLPVTLLSFIVAGAYLGFLVFNIYPQKMMSGFGASTLAGFFLSVLAMMSGAKLATAILVLSVPMIDAFFVILGRLRKRKSPFMGDRSHLHHKLLDAGWGKRRVAAFYWATAAILGLIALQLNSEQKLFTISVVFVLLAGLILWSRFFFTQFVKPGRVSG